MPKHIHDFTSCLSREETRSAGKRLASFCFYKDQGAAGARPAFESFALGLARDPALLARLAETFSHRRSPYDVATPAHAVRWALAALLRGHFGMLRDFAAMGRRSASQTRTRDLHRAEAVGSVLWLIGGNRLAGRG